MRMKDILMSKVEEVVAEKLKQFFTQVECEYNIPKDTLWKKWNGEEKEKHLPKKEPITAKKSDYQAFFSAQRNRMVKENPNITFGEISKQVSHMWKKLSPEEKAQHTYTNTTHISREDMRKEYMKTSTTDLKNMCKEKGIVVRSRKKEDLIAALLEWDTKKPVFPSGDMPTKGRSKLELSAEDKDEDEEDFYFHDDSSTTSNESRACDEDGIMISDDDDDIFGDDD